MDDQPKPRLKISTLAAQALGAHDPMTKGVVPPLHLSTTFLRDPDNGYSSGHVYGRADNLSVQQAEDVIAALEGADEAFLFGSGMSAATTLVMSLERPTHIIASQVMYWGFRSWLKECSRYGHSVTFVDTSDLEVVKRAVVPGKTGLFWLETPSNPLWSITDIEAVSEIAHSVGALVCVDSTVSTPILTRPLSLGADIVMHSATKYLNGHSDVIAGSLATVQRTPFWNEIRKMRRNHGSVLAPFDAWLLMRGMRTLDLRVKAQSKTAAMLAERLSYHPAVSHVLYPGLSDHPGHEIAARQMTGGFGGMLSIRLEKAKRRRSLPPLVCVSGSVRHRSAASRA